MTGTKFAKVIAGMTGEELQAKAIEELRRDNVPDFLRNLKPVHLSYYTLSDETITAVNWITPDYGGHRGEYSLGKTLFRA